MDEIAFLIDDIIDGTARTPWNPPKCRCPSYPAAARHRFARVAQRQTFREAIRTLPAPGEAVHCTTGGKFELFTWVPEIVAWLGSVDSLYASTWTCSRVIAAELFQLADGGKIGPIHFVTGLYFKRRESRRLFLLAGKLAATRAEPTAPSRITPRSCCWQTRPRATS